MSFGTENASDWRLDDHDRRIHRLEDRTDLLEGQLRRKDLGMDSVHQTMIVGLVVLVWSIAIGLLIGAALGAHA